MIDWRQLKRVRMQVGNRVRTKKDIGWTEEDHQQFGNKEGVIVVNTLPIIFRLDLDEVMVKLDDYDEPLMFLLDELELVDGWTPTPSIKL